MPYKRLALWDWLRIWPKTVYWRFFWNVPKDGRVRSGPHPSRTAPHARVSRTASSTYGRRGSGD